jgi:hypothetical protein
MGEGEFDTESGSDCDSHEDEESLPELAPWRQVGWIFRDGDSIAIERQGERLRSRVLAGE